MTVQHSCAQCGCLAPSAGGTCALYLQCFSHTFRVGHEATKFQALPQKLLHNITEDFGSSLIAYQTACCRRRPQAQCRGSTCGLKQKVNSPSRAACCSLHAAVASCSQPVTWRTCPAGLRAVHGGQEHPSGGKQCPTHEWPPLGPPLAGAGPLPATCTSQVELFFLDTFVPLWCCKAARP